MKKTGGMNSNISRVIADMGHMDWLGVGGCRNSCASWD